MATTKQAQAARTNVRRAHMAATAKLRDLPGWSTMGRDELASRSASADAMRD